MSTCSNCGRELFTGALYCPSCGARAVDFSIPQTDVSPSHFNAGMTATALPQTTVAPEDTGFALPPSPLPGGEEALNHVRKGKAMVAIIGVLVLLLVGATFEAGILGVSAGGVPAINSPSTP